MIVFKKRYERRQKIVRIESKIDSLRQDLASSLRRRTRVIDDETLLRLKAGESTDIIPGSDESPEVGE